MSHSLENADTDSLAAAIMKRLTALGATIATAESCTGGLLAATLTEIPGASAVLGYGWVTYSAAAKMRELGVPPSLIESHTVVSEPVVEAMARSAADKAKAAYAIAISGNAGPTAPPGEPPVGSVCIAIAYGSSITSTSLYRPGLSRSSFRRFVVHQSLLLLHRLLPSPLP